MEFRQQVSAGKITVEGAQEVQTHAELCAHLHLPEAECARFRDKFEVTLAIDETLAIIQ